MKDWVERTLKTFIEAFLGVLIPCIVAVLNNIVDYSNIHEIWIVLFPVICAGIASGITAVWNIYLEKKDCI